MQWPTSAEKSTDLNSLLRSFNKMYWDVAYRLLCPLYDKSNWTVNESSLNIKSLMYENNGQIQNGNIIQLTLHILGSKLRFWHLFVIQLTPKIWLFQNINDSASKILLEALNDLKKGFFSIFVVSWTKIWILECVFLPFGMHFKCCFM